jgi:PilZ domain
MDLGTSGSESDPVSRCIPHSAAVTAIGMDLHGRCFLCNLHTELVAPKGCTLPLKHALAVDDEMDIQIGNRELRGRVAGKLGSTKGLHVYAIQFDDAAAACWDVAFPEESDPQPTFPLHCSACDLAGDVTLSAIELLVLETNGAITRTCPRCSERTRWGRERGGNYQGRSKGFMPSTAPALGNSGREAVPQRDMILPLASRISPYSPRPRDVEQRRSSRVQLKGGKACVESVGLGSDIVAVVDLSKGGLRFLSFKRYHPGDGVRVAVPYTVAGNNIFVTAEIVRMQKVRSDCIPGEYALVFRSA